MSNTLLVRLFVHRPTIPHLRKVGQAASDRYLHDFVVETTDRFVNHASEWLEPLVPQSSLLLTADFVDRHTNGHPAPISVEFRLKLPQALWPHFERIANRYIRYGKDFVEEVWDTVRPSKDPDVTCPVYMIAAEANGRTHGILVPYPNHVQKIDS